MAPGRWHRQGVAVVYCCDHPSTALLEILVHVQKHQVPREFQLLRIECPDSVPLINVDLGSIDLTKLDLTQAEGSKLLSNENIGVIRVPSIIMPEACNYLINPNHVRSAEIKIETVTTYPFDSRLFK